MALHFDELDRKAAGKSPDDTADAGPNSERRSDLQRQLGGDRGTADRHVNDIALMDGAIGLGQRRTRTGRDHARMLSSIENLRIVQLPFQPGEFVRELLAHGIGHIEFEQKVTRPGITEARCLSSFNVIKVCQQPGNDIDLATTFPPLPLYFPGSRERRRRDAADQEIFRRGVAACRAGNPTTPGSARRRSAND